MATKKTGPSGVAVEPAATGWVMTGGTTTQKVLTVSEDVTLDQDLQKSASPTFAGITIDAVTITDIENAAAGLSDSDGKMSTNAAIVDYVETQLASAGEVVSVLTDDLATAVKGNLYVANKAGTACSITLPATAGVGDRIGVIGMGATGFKLIAAAGDTIQVQNLITKAGGYVQNVGQFDSLEVVCEVADTTWVARRITGSFNVEVS